MMEWSPTEIKDILKLFWKVGDRRSVLLLGASGIGKTQMVRELAEEIAKMEGLELVEVVNGNVNEIDGRDDIFVLYPINLSTKQPYELDGIPRDDSDETFKYKVLKAFKAMKGKKGILFIDEITNIQRFDMHSALYNVLQFRKVGDNYLGNDIWVIGAGNRPKDSGIAQELPAPEVNRVKILNVKPPSVDEWIEWMNKMYDDEWDKSVGAFLKRFPEYIHSAPARGRTLSQFPTHRNWTDVARYIGQILSTNIDSDIVKMGMSINEIAMNAHVVGLVGEKVGGEYLAFRKLMKDIPDVEYALSKPETLRNLKLDGQYLFIASFVQTFDDNNLAKYRKILNWMAENNREMLALWWQLLGSKERRKKILAKIDADVKMSKVFDVLVWRTKVKYGVV